MSKVIFGQEEKYSLIKDHHCFYVYPRIIERFGVNTAVVLCYLHQLIEECGESCEDGYEWVRISVGEIGKFLCFLSKSTISKIISDLRNDGIVVTENKNESPYDRTNWYRINYERLDSLLLEDGGE